MSGDGLETGISVQSIPAPWAGAGRKAPDDDARGAGG